MSSEPNTMVYGEAAETKPTKRVRRSRSSSETQAKTANDSKSPFAPTINPNLSGLDTATTQQVTSRSFGGDKPEDVPRVSQATTLKAGGQTSYSFGSSFKSTTTNPSVGRLNQKSSRATNATSSFSTGDPISSGDLSQWSYKSGLGLAHKTGNVGTRRDAPATQGFSLPQETLTEETPSSPPKHPGTPQKSYSQSGTPDKTKSLFRTERSGSHSSAGSSSPSKRSPLSKTRPRHSSSLDENDSVVEIWKPADDACDSPVAYRIDPPEATEREVTTQSRTITSTSNDSEGILFRKGKVRHDTSPGGKSIAEYRSASMAAPEEQGNKEETTPLNGSTLEGSESEKSKVTRFISRFTTKELPAEEKGQVQQAALWLLCLITVTQYILQSLLFDGKNDDVDSFYSLPLVALVVVFSVAATVTRLGRKHTTACVLLTVAIVLVYHTIGIFPAPAITSGNMVPLIVLAPFLFGGNILLVGSVEMLAFACIIVGHFASGKATTDLDRFQLVIMSVTVASLVLLETRRSHHVVKVADASTVDTSKGAQNAIVKEPPPPPHPFRRTLDEKVLFSQYDSPAKRHTRKEKSDSTGSDSSPNSAPDSIFPPSLQNRPIRSQSMSLNVGHERSTTVSRIQRAYFNLAHSTSELMKQLRSFMGSPSGQYSRVPEEEYSPQQFSSVEVKKALEAAQRELHVARVLGVNVPRRRLSKEGYDTNRSAENEEAFQHIIDMISPAHATRSKRGSDVTYSGRHEAREKTGSGPEAMQGDAAPSGISNSREERISTSSSSNCLTKVGEGGVCSFPQARQNPSRCHLYSIYPASHEPPKSASTILRRNSGFDVATRTPLLCNTKSKKRSLSTSDLVGSSNRGRRRTSVRVRPVNWEDPRYFESTSSPVIRNLRSVSVDVFDSARRYLRNGEKTLGDVRRPEDLSFPFHEIDYSAYTQAEPLITIMGKIYQECLISFERLNIPRNAYLRYFELVETRYQVNPYHNKFHAADVACTAYRLAANSQIFKFMRPLDQLALVTAAAVHDLDHPGYTNTFLINVQDPIAIRYNDKSVLENHHAASAFALLGGDRHSNMLESLSKEEYFQFRETVIDLVLITDLAHHVQFVEDYRQMIAQNEPVGGEDAHNASRTWSSGSIGQMKQSFGSEDGSECKHLSLEWVLKCPTCKPFAVSLKTLGETMHSGLRSRKDQLLVWKLLLKTADVGHAAKPTALHLKWSQRIVEEMFRQGDVESNMGMPVSPLMNRNRLDGLSKSQVGFIDFICMPLFQSWDAVALASIAYTSLSRRENSDGDGSTSQEQEFHELCLDVLRVRSDDLFMAPMASRNRELWENMGVAQS
eukprot:gb/GECG01013490.1/.p1 GENE.gb/GECG01013490.1/~~gb/GECG01013490.1/.p1  ORF type:complete len:1331 (+),score=166.12 gb/GECG01013490.1/:1-3993(+)